MNTTPCLTVFEDMNKEDMNKDEIVVMYRHYDGYPKCHGKALAFFLKALYEMDNIVFSENRRIISGMEYLAPHYIAALTSSHFRKDVHLYPPWTRGLGEEYIYVVSLDSDDTPVITLYEKDTKKKNKIFSGTTYAFIEWLGPQETKEINIKIEYD